MRYALPALFVFVLMLAPFVPAPVGPAAAEAADDPAFLDGGCNVAFTDGGTTVTIDTFITTSWNASFTVTGAAACYKTCEYSSGSDPATCSASRSVCPGLLKQDSTYDIAIPAGRRFLSFTSADAGTGLNVCVGRVTP